MAAGYVPDADDIVCLQVDPQAGHEQAGHRPAVVLSPASYNKRAGMVICCPTTTRIKAWLAWFLAVLDRSLSDADGILAATIRKGRFWEAMAELPINQRQREMLNRLLDGFEGKLTSSKWAQIGTCSQDTALRDINDLTGRGVLIQDAAGGRSTSYSLKDGDSG